MTGTRLSPPSLRIALTSLVSLAIVLVAFPAIFRLPWSAPGLQTLTPQKVVLPLLTLPLMFHFLRRGELRRGMTPMALAFAGLILWLLVGVLANWEVDLLYNLRGWAWLPLYFLLFLGVQELVARPDGIRVIVGSALACVSLVALFGFLELVFTPALDGFFWVFRPNWAHLRLTGPGPESMLPLHAYTGARMRLMSTLGNDAGYVLALGAVLLGGLCVARGATGVGSSRLANGAALASYSVVVWAVTLTLSRSGLLMILAGGGVLLLASLLMRPAWLARAALVLSIGVALIGMSVLMPRSVLAEKIAGLSTRVETGAPRAEVRVPSGGTAQREDEPGSVPRPGSPTLAAIAGDLGPQSPEEEAGVRELGAWSVRQRVLMARAALNMIRDSPFFGVGFANFRARLYSDPDYMARFWLTAKILDVQDPHNFFLWVGAIGGVPALAALVAVLLLAFAVLWRAWRRTTSDHGLVLVLCACWVAFLAFMWMGLTLLTAASQSVFAVMLGTTAGVDRRVRPGEGRSSSLAGS